jgi:hypothetical protein
VQLPRLSTAAHEAPVDDVAGAEPLARHDRDVRLDPDARADRALGERREVRVIVHEHRAPTVADPLDDPRLHALPEHVAVRRAALRVHRRRQSPTCSPSAG